MKKLAIQTVVFLIVLIVHFVQSNCAIARTVEQYGVEADYFETYFDRFEVYLGLFWGLAAAFVTYVLLKYRERKTHEGIVGGLLVTLIVFFAGYFLLGLNGSGMYFFYINKLGWFYSNIVKPLTLIWTVIAVIPGYIMIYRKTRKT